MAKNRPSRICLRALLWWVLALFLAAHLARAGGAANYSRRGAATITGPAAIAQAQLQPCADGAQASTDASISSANASGGPACAAASSQTCLSPTGDSEQEVVINNLLSTGGAGTAISLCPDTTFNLNRPVRFTATNQEISTAGYPADSSRAMLVVNGAAQSTAIEGNCAPCSGIKLLSIQVNGNRPGLGRIANGAALIELGGSVSGQLVQHVHSFEPRGWSALHVFEGALNCSGVNVLDNDIGPAGQPPGQWADGISYACTNGRVANNVVTDATDGGIVVFQAPGSIIENNTIIAQTRTLMGGINMVDYNPYKGNYSGTIVRNNVIDARGAMIKVGIAIGPAVWMDSKKVVYGATVTNNHVEGNYLGYALAVSGAAKFTISDNTASGKYFGKQDLESDTNTDPYPKCPHRNPLAQAFLMNPKTSHGNFQGQPFARSTSFKILICIQPILP